MNLKKGRSYWIVLLAFFVIQPEIGKSQCHEDFYGYWTTTDGKFIKHIKGDADRDIKSESRIGFNKESYEGAYFFENHIFKIHYNKYYYSEETNSGQSVKKQFEFNVIYVDKQIMKIRPISNDIIELFGEKDIVLFNEDFISFDDFELDSIHYSRMHSPYVLQIDNSGNLKIEVNLDNEKKQEKIYRSTLSKEEMQALKEIVIQSQITSVSYCTLNHNSCSDCLPHYIKIFHNGKFTLFNSGHARQFSGASQLIYYLIELIQQMKQMNE